MKTEAYNYYQNEINKINAHTYYSPKIKMTDETNETKWISLNKESAEVLIKWLKRNYNIK